MSMHVLLDKFDEIKTKLTDKEYKNVTEAIQKVFKDFEKLKKKEGFSPHYIKYAKSSMENFCLTKNDVRGNSTMEICEYLHPFVCIDEKMSVPILEEAEGKIKKITFKSSKPNLLIPSDWLFQNLSTEYCEIIGEDQTNLCGLIRRIPCEKILLLEITPYK